MGQKNIKRSRLWVNSGFQSRILLRLGLYGFLFVLSLWHVTFVIDLMNRIASNSGSNWDLVDLYVDFAARQKPLAIAFVLIAPIMLLDMLKFSHRIAGPLFRVRRYFTDMIEGKPVPEFRAREKDLMPEFFELFNDFIQIWNARLQLANVQAQHAALAPKEGTNGQAPAPATQTAPTP